MPARRPVKIVSTDNNFQRLEVLKRNRQKRFHYGTFVVEGVRNINQAVGNGWKVQSFLYADGGALSDWARDLLSSVRTEVNFALAPHLMESLSDKEETSEILAVVEMRNPSLDALALNSLSCILLCDRPSNPGNLGSIIRSADAFGVQAVLLYGHAVDPCDPRTVRASMGSYFSLPVVHVPSFENLENWLGQMRQLVPLNVIAAVEDGVLDAREFDFEGALVLCVGNEGTGVSRSIASLCDQTVRIPMTGTTSSLNVSCAASILLYEAFLKRNRSAKKEISAS